MREWLVKGLARLRQDCLSSEGETLAEDTVTLICEEIEKVHYSALDIDPDHATFSEGFHWAKQEILSLLRSEKKI